MNLVQMTIDRKIFLKYNTTKKTLQENIILDRWEEEERGKTNPYYREPEYGYGH